MGDWGGGSQAGWWGGGEDAQKEGAGGEQAMETEAGLGPLPPVQSDALSLENMAMASGKLGGVAGVFRGVHIWGGAQTRHRLNTSSTHVKKHLHSILSKAHSTCGISVGNPAVQQAGHETGHVTGHVTSRTTCSVIFC